jgi:hypothetical protein
VNASELTKMKAALGDTAAYQYATIYAQWRQRVKALEWLETAKGSSPGSRTSMYPYVAPYTA